MEGGSANITISNNTVICLNGGSGVFLYANGASQSNMTIVGGLYKTVAGAPIRIDRSDAFTTTGLTISGVRAITTDNTPNGITVTGGVGVSISACYASVGTSAALYLASCTTTRVEGGNFLTTGGTGVNISGTSTSSFFAKSNTYSGNISNTGTGSNIELLSSGAPSGSFMQGDISWSTAPTSGAAPGQVYTATGWKNMAVLA